MKKYLFLSILLTSTHIFAADVILLKNSVRIDAKILDVSSSEIKYQLLDTLPELILTQDLNNVSSVVFDNGEIYTGTALINETSSISKCPLFGVTVGGGIGYHYLHGLKPYYYSHSVGIDVVWKIKNSNALGFYVKTGSVFCRRDNSDFGFRITAGLLGSAGVISDKGSFLYGIGLGFQSPIQNAHIPLEIRLGGAFKNGFYFTADVSLDLSSGYLPFSDLTYGPSIHLGYNFQHNN